MTNKKEILSAYETILEWVKQASDEEVANINPSLSRLKPGNEVSNYPYFAREYPKDFKVDEAYRDTLPDLQNGPSSLIRGANVKIDHVGISNFNVPLKYTKKDGQTITLKTSVTGTVSLDADKKGINMSRILRSFYPNIEDYYTSEVSDKIVDDYRSDLDSHDAFVLTRVSYPILVESLRSGMWGYQYYDIAQETSVRNGVRRTILHLDFVYSSTCPCSLELSEHARRERNQLASPHSQRSVARISVLLSEFVWFEDIIEACRKAVPTETQVMVKREDEQAFAELNAANPIFVEDAVRLFSESLMQLPGVTDFRVVASHQESLHSHDAVAIAKRGSTFDDISIDPYLFASLHKQG